MTPLRPNQNLIKRFADTQPLTRTQYAIGAVALLWAVPVLLLVGLNWGPVSAWMNAAKHAEWAAALGAISAAWAAVWAARYPYRVQRAQNRGNGALEAAASRNLIGMVQASVMGLGAPESSAAHDLHQINQAIDILNSIPIDSIQHFDGRLAQSLRETKGQLIIGRTAATNPKITAMVAGGVNRYLDAAMKRLPRADAYVKNMFLRADADD